MRQEQAANRRALILHLLAEGTFGTLHDWGIRTRLAAALHVHPSTISRDVARIIEKLDPVLHCPSCGRPGHEEDGLPWRVIQGLRSFASAVNRG